MPNLQQIQMVRGLYVLGLRDSKNRSTGCVVTSLSQIETSPAILVLSTRKNSYTSQNLSFDSTVTISVLSRKCNHRVIEIFGYNSGNDTDKWQSIDCEEFHGLPVLTKHDASACLYGKVSGRMEFRTHYVWFVEITDSRIMSSDAALSVHYFQQEMEDLIRLSLTEQNESLHSVEMPRTDEEQPEDQLSTPGEDEYDITVLDGDSFALASGDTAAVPGIPEAGSTFPGEDLSLSAEGETATGINDTPGINNAPAQSSSPKAAPENALADKDAGAAEENWLSRNTKAPAADPEPEPTPASTSDSATQKTLDRAENDQEANLEVDLALAAIVPPATGVNASFKEDAAPGKALDQKPRQEPARSQTQAPVLDLDLDLTQDPAQVPDQDQTLTLSLDGEDFAGVTAGDLAPEDLQSRKEPEPDLPDLTDLSDLSALADLPDPAAGSRSGKAAHAREDFPERSFPGEVPAGTSVPAAQPESSMAPDLSPEPALAPDLEPSQAPGHGQSPDLVREQDQKREQDLAQAPAPAGTAERNLGFTGEEEISPAVPDTPRIAPEDTPRTPQGADPELRIRPTPTLVPEASLQDRNSPREEEQDPQGGRTWDELEKEVQNLLDLRDSMYDQVMADRPTAFPESAGGSETLSAAGASGGPAQEEDEEAVNAALAEAAGKGGIRPHDADLPTVPEETEETPGKPGKIEEKVPAADFAAALDGAMATGGIAPEGESASPESDDKAESPAGADPDSRTARKKGHGFQPAGTSLIGAAQLVKSPPAPPEPPPPPPRELPRGSAAAGSASEFSAILHSRINGTPDEAGSVGSHARAKPRSIADTAPKVVSRPAAVSFFASIYRCPICHYEHRGKLPGNFVCPMCGFAGSEFEVVE